MFIDPFMDTYTFEKIITEAYLFRNRDLLGGVTNLQCEASELAELVVKNQWYGKEYSKQDVLSEAGDVLNFLTFILQEHGLTLHQAMSNNCDKLKTRGWIE